MTKQKKLFQKIKKVPSLTKYVIFSISIVMIYSVLDIILQCHEISLSDTLTTCVYSFFGGEVVTCALIKIFKLKESGSDVVGEEYEVIN